MEKQSIVLQNGQLKAKIAHLGAELQSLVFDGKELMWQADPAVWARHAPILFPIIGRLKGGSYTAEGQTYTIMQHGFARDRVFEVASQDESSCTLRLCADAESKKLYPWDFALEIRYRLEGNRLWRQHRVTNLDKRPLYFELGGHDGFALGFSDAENDRYFVQFDEEALAPLCFNKDFLLTTQKRTVPLQNGRLYLDDAELFSQDALVLDDMAVRCVTLGSEQSRTKVKMGFADFAYFAVWSKYTGEKPRFVCFEPWSALPDCEDLDEALAHKRGILCLAPQQSRSLSLWISAEKID